MTNYSVVTLNQCLEKLESGGRPKGGASLDKNGILSIGAEHLGDDGEIKLENPKFIPLTYFENMRQGIVQDEDILIVKDGATTGKVVYISSNSLPNKTAVNEHVFLLRTNKKLLLPKFAFYLMYSPTGKQKILADFRGAAQGGISRSFVNNFTFTLPPLSEQRRIVEILDQADEIRKLRKQADEKAEKIIPALFYEMFGDIMKSKYPKKRIGEIAKRITKGESPHWQGFKYQETGVRFITSENVRDGFLDLQKSKFVSEEFDSKLNRSRLSENDVLINLVGASIGRAAIVPSEALPANINQAVASITVDNAKILPSFLLHQILHPFIQRIIKGNIVEGARANISLANVRDLEVIIPNIKTQINFDNKVKAICSIKNQNLILSNKLQNLFNLLLSKAFDGSLTASWREAHMKELLKEMEEQKKYFEQAK